MAQPIHGTNSWPKIDPLPTPENSTCSSQETTSLHMLMDLYSVKELPPCQCKDVLASNPESLRARIAAATSLQELCPYARTARPYISFWGTRRVFFEGYGESVGINFLTQRVLELLKQNPSFNKEEQSHGQTVASHIDRLYEQSKLLIAECNPLTRGLAKLARQIRLIFDISNPEYVWTRSNPYGRTSEMKFTYHGDYPYIPLVLLFLKYL